MNCIEYNNSDCVEKLEEDFDEFDIKVKLSYLDREIFSLLEERGELVKRLEDLRENE